MNSVVLIGRLARDPELKYVPSSGMAITRISLAVDRGMFGEKKEQAIAAGKPTCDFINITVFGKSAENAANYLAKGSQCAVHGRISTGSYTKNDGTKAYTTDVIADKVEFVGNKKDNAQASTPTGTIDDLQNLFDDNDIFQPVDDEEIPF